MQVIGRPRVRRVALGVSANLALIEAAAAKKADMLICHHGLFTDRDPRPILTREKRRLKALFDADMTLLGYHLPLDAHPELGNNAQLGLRLQLQADARFGDQDLGFIGSGPDALTLDDLLERVRQTTGRMPTVVRGDERPLRRIAWCTGGAQGYFEAAIAARADAYITGEISEPQAHYARETGVAFIACGHHASERYGAAAVGACVARQFGIEHRFIDIDNPA
jgi:dinuclear metal center YbgI/SA1388 family protein